MPWTITLKDGTLIEESEIRSKHKDGRCQFDYTRTDIKYFELEVYRGERIGVDLETGLFYMNGMAVNPDHANEGHTYRLVYWKRHRAYGADRFKDRIRWYMVGWQFTENEHNTQRIRFWDMQDDTVEIRRKR